MSGCDAPADVLIIHFHANKASVIHIKLPLDSFLWAHNLKVQTDAHEEQAAVSIYTVYCVFILCAEYLYCVLSIYTVCWVFILCAVYLYCVFILCAVYLYCVLSIYTVCWVFILRTVYLYCVLSIYTVYCVFILCAVYLYCVLCLLVGTGIISTRTVYSYIYYLPVYSVKSWFTQNVIIVSSGHWKLFLD